MKVLIVSDNHREKTMIEKLPKEIDVDLYIHLGDSELSSEDALLEPYEYVKGNTDYDMSFRTEQLYDGLIYFTHGHLYHVNRDRNLLASKAKALGAIYALYGHTHIAKVEKINDVYCINPGSISASRSSEPETYAVLDTEEKIVTFYKRDGEVLKQVELE